MRREELAGILRQAYTAERGCGVLRVPNAGYENIWFVVPPPPPREVPAGLPVGSVGQANRILQSRPSPVTATPLDRLAIYLFARREAVASSRMEGTWSTIDDVLTPAEFHDQEAERSATASVRGYALALEAGYQEMTGSGIIALTTPLICNLHNHVMSRDPGFHGVPGQLRTPGSPGDVVQIGGGGRKEESIYNPTPPSHVAETLEGVMAWLRDRTLIEMGDAGMGMSLPVRMAIGHAHFEAVHPFSDGNGRVGRLLWPLQIMGAGHLPVYLSGYVEKHREAYGQALQEAQKQLSYTRIVDFVCNAIITCHDEEVTTKHVIATLPETWARRGRFRVGSAAAKTLNVLLRAPIMTARGLESELGVSFQAASNALNALATRGVVRERTGHGRNRVFAAEEVISVLARPFGEDPEVGLEGARAALGVAG